MLKKAGIVVAGAACTLVALSPLAFADPGVVQNNGRDESNTANGLLAGNVLNNNEVNVPINACDNNLNAFGIQLADLTGAGAFLGSAEAVNSTQCTIVNGSGGAQGNSIGK